MSASPPPPFHTQSAPDSPSSPPQRRTTLISTSWRSTRSAFISTSRRSFISTSWISTRSAFISTLRMEIHLSITCACSLIFSDSSPSRLGLATSPSMQWKGGPSTLGSAWPFFYTSSLTLFFSLLFQVNSLFFLIRFRYRQFPISQFPQK